jgi:NAD(P)-dependent dehydrogenase (short-subunit alcohol dehydrogenase family)
MLFLNAGIPTGGPTTGEGLPLSEDGIEMVFATNHVGHHLLYKLLEPTLKLSPMARVVLTSSAANYRAPEYGVATDLHTLNNPGTSFDLFSSFKIPKEYGQSKLAQVLFAQELTRQLPTDSNIYVNSFHPGAVDTKIWGKNPSIPGPILWLIEKLQEGFMWSGEDGCLTMLYLGTATDALKEGNVRGQYFHPQAMRVTPNKKFTQDPAVGQAVWKFTETLIQS